MILKKKKSFDINPAKPDNRSNHYLTDFFNNYDEVSHKIKVIDNVLSARNLIKNVIHYSNYRIWIYYGLISLSIALVCYTIEMIPYQIIQTRIKVVNEVDYLTGLFIWLITAIILGTISTATCHVLGQEAQGAGVAEIKCILTGSRLYEYLDFRILAAKVISLITALGGGFYIGRVGPCLHLGGLISFNIAKLDIFKFIKTDSVLKVQSIMIGSAIGLSCAFGTPLAGLIAGIELIEKISTVRTIWVLYVCLFLSTVIEKLLFSLNLTPSVHAINHNTNELSTDLIQFGILGIVCGLISAFFINISMYYQLYRYKKTTSEFFRSRYAYTWVAIIVTSLLQYHFSFLRIGDKNLLNDFFSDKPLPSKWYLSDDSNIMINLIIYLIFKCVTFFLAMTSPIPGGVFGPFMMMGCSLGRLFGEISYYVLKTPNIGRFAIAGSAALSATSTKFLAMTLVIVELTQDINIAVPIMITVLFSFGVGNFFTKSYFYSTIELRKLPFLPKLMNEEIYKQKAKDIIQFPKFFLHANSNLSDIFEFLSRGKNICLGDYIPITINSENMTLVGIIKTQNLIMYFKKCLRLFENQYKSCKWISQTLILLKSYLSLDEEAIIDGKLMCKVAKNNLIKIKKNKKKKDIYFINSENTEKSMINFSFLESNLNSELENDMFMEEKKEEFFSKIIDYANKLLHFDRSPVCVNLSAHLSKVHYLFIMLGISTVFVIDKGVLKGVIKRNYFLGLNNKKEYRN